MIVRRLLSEFKNDWSEGVNKKNYAIIESINDIHNKLENNISPKIINIYIILESYNKIIPVTVDFQNITTYPFKPPKIRINNKYDYFSCLATIPEYLVKEKFGLRCMCCNSVLCNWSVKNSISDIVEECYESIKLKLRSLNIIAAKICTIKKFGHYLPIAEFL